MSQENEDLPDFIKEKLETVGLTPLKELPENVDSDVFDRLFTLSGCGTAGKYEDVPVYSGNKGCPSPYNRLVAYIIVGEADCETGLGTNEGIFEITEDGANEQIVAAYLTRDSLFVILSPVIFYKGELDGPEGKKAQETALELARLSAATAITQYVEEGMVFESNEDED